MGAPSCASRRCFCLTSPLSNPGRQAARPDPLEIQKLHRRAGITSLFVTHDQVEAMTLAQRMMVMNAGVMEQFGTPEEVYTARRPPLWPASSARPHEPAEERPGASPEPSPASGPSTGHWHRRWEARIETMELLGAERLLYARGR